MIGIHNLPDGENERFAEIKKQLNLHGYDIIEVFGGQQYWANVAQTEIFGIDWKPGLLVGQSTSDMVVNVRQWPEDRKERQVPLDDFVKFELGIWVAPARPAIRTQKESSFAGLSDGPGHGH